MILHVIDGVAIFSLIFQYSFDRVVEFLYLSWVKDALWLPYLFFNVGSHSPMYFFSGWLGLLDFSVASYTILDARQFWLSEQFSLLVQLQVVGFWMSWVGIVIHLLCLFMTDFMFGMQL